MTDLKPYVYQAARALLATVGAGGAEPLRKHAAAPQAVQDAVPDNWRDRFSESVYEDLSAADNQDVPLEEYPARILSILDAIVGPRHPTVIKWRNDAIRSCIAIAYKYCSDPESHRYLKQDLEAMLAAPAHPAEEAQSSLADALDAARYRFLRDTCWSSDKELATVISLQMNKVWDEKIDEAMARNKKE